MLITTSEALGREVIELIDRILPEMPTRDYAEPAWRDFGQVIVVDDIEEAYRVADGFAFEHVQVLTADPRRALDADAQLRCAVPRREHLRLLRRQGDRDEPRAAHPRRRALHRRALGREVPEDRHLPGGAQRQQQRRAGPGLRPGRAGRALRGPRPLRRHPGPPAPRRPVRLGRPGAGRRRAGRSHDVWPAVRH